MEIKKRRSSTRTMVVFAYISVLIISLFACDDQKDGSSAHSGKLRLSLNADTTSLKKGVNSNLTKAVADEFEQFLTVEDYKIQILTEKDTVKSYDRFDQLPSEIELPEGAYTIVASKGNDLPAEFENPYFEGSTAFTIKEGMSTPLDVTCTLGNARITAEYTDDFKEAYSEYTVLLSSSYTSTDLEIAKGETRPAYLQVAKEGTDVAIGIRLKKINAEEEKTYYVPTALKLERRQNVRLVFKTDGEALEGIGLDIVLDDTLEEVTFTTEIPDFMWQQFTKPTLSADGFKGDGTDEVFKTTAGSFDRDLQVGVVMSGGIGSLTISYWREGEAEDDAISYDLATDDGVTAAKEKHFAWTFGEEKDIKLFKKKVAQLYLKDGINSLESLEDKSCIYYFKLSGNDATGKSNASNELRFQVEVLPATAPAVSIKQGESLAIITEGDELNADWQLNFAATGLMDLEATKVIVSDGTNDQEYYFLKDDGASLKSVFGATVEIENSAHAIVSFPKVFTTSLLAPEEGSKDYTFTFYLKDQKGKEDKHTNTVTVNAPVFTLETTEGDAFARRIVLRANISQGNGERLSFQYRQAGNGNWINIPSAVKPDGNQYVDTLKNLEVSTSYDIQAVYNKSQTRISEIVTVTTEAPGTLPNGGFEEWSIAPDANGNTVEGSDADLNGITGVFANVPFPFRCWEVWQPWTSSSSEGWNTLNLFTTSAGGLHDGSAAETSRKWTRYVANSGTIKTAGVSGYAALIRTVGWGAGNTATPSGGLGSVRTVTPGELYLGLYNDGAKYGISFNSRPSGFKFDYKYVRKNADQFIAEIVVLDKDKNVIAISGIPSVKASDSWITGYVMLNYSGTNRLAKAAMMYIRFVSGKSTSTDELMIYPPKSNLSNGEYVGSQLYIDNVELIYE